MRQALALCFMALILASCAPSVPYSSDYPMTEELFRSREGVLSGRIPTGWFSSTEDTLAPALSAWLLREDYSAALSVKELRLDRLSSERVKSEGLRNLAFLNAGFEGHEQSMREIREFRMEGNAYCAYEYGESATPARVVVFSVRGRYFACTVERIKGTWASKDFELLFRIQQSVLFSLTY